MFSSVTLMTKFTLNNIWLDLENEACSLQRLFEGRVLDKLCSMLIVLTEWGSVACFVRQSQFAPCVRNFPGSSQHESSRSGCQRAKAGGICIKKVLTASISQPETPVPHVSYASSNPTQAALSVWLIRSCWLSLFRRAMICSPLAQQPDR